MVLPYLARTVGAGGVFSIVLGVVWGLVYLLFLYEIHGKLETDLGNFLQEFVPTGVRVAVQMWLIAHCIAVAGFAAYLFGTLMQYSLLDGESFLVILVVILAIAAYAISGGMESRARVYEVLFWFVLVPLIVMLVAAGTQMESVYFEGMTDVGFLDMLQGSYLVFLFFATAFWTLFFTKYLARQDEQLDSEGERNRQARRSGVSGVAQRVNAGEKKLQRSEQSTAGTQKSQQSEQSREEKKKLQWSEQSKAGKIRSRERGNLQEELSKKRGITSNREGSIEGGSSGWPVEYGGFFQRVALAIVLAGALLAVAYLVCLGNFGGAALAGMDFPIITLMSSIRIPGNFVKRLDALMIAVWFFMLFGFLNLHLFYGVRVMQNLVGEPLKQMNASIERTRDQKEKTTDQANSVMTRQRKGCSVGRMKANSVKSFSEKNTGNKEQNLGRMIAITVVLAGILALLYYYNSAAVNIFFGYIYYAGTPLLVVAPLMIYWFGRGRRT